ncbi:transposase [Spirochaetia bacterium]|nr:transposase [Spirochaetia bacterium]
MDNDFIPPTFDYIVKGVFGSQDDIGNTIGLLTPILGIDPAEYAGVFITDPFLNQDSPEGKKSILDIKLIFPSGKTIQVEVQVRDLKNMTQRVLYDQAKMITDQMQMGDDYQIIQPIISVLILDHVMFPDEPKYLNTYEFLNTESHRPFTDLQKVITLELPKLPKTDDGCPVWPWGKFFTCQSEEEMETLTTVHPEVRPSVERYEQLAQTDYMRDLYRYEQKKRLDAKAREDFVRDEGLEKGLKEGLAQGLELGKQEGDAIGYNRAKEEALKEARQQMETLARKLKDLGVTEDKIALATGLSVGEVGR